MPRLSKDVISLIGKPPESKDPEQKKVAEKKTTQQSVRNNRPICQNCKHCGRKTKQCTGTGGKFVPRKGTCEAFDTAIK